jgi:hypothetical protein
MKTIRILMALRACGIVIRIIILCAHMLFVSRQENRQ